MIYPPPTIYMTAEDIYTWRHTLGLSKREAAQALGVARNTYRCYEIGKHAIPRYIWLATRTISAMKAAA